MTERSTVEILRAARERISDPERFTQGVYARGPLGGDVEPNSDTACAWCAAGSVFAEIGVGAWADDPIRYRKRFPAFELLIQAAKEADGRPRRLAQINDSVDGHEAVLAVYDRAISLAEGASC